MTGRVLRRGFERIISCIIGPAIEGGAFRVAVAIAIVMLAVLLGPCDTLAAPTNLLNNGDFVRGSGTSCDGWRIDAWVLSPTATEFNWIQPSGGAPAELEIDTHHDNDARWVQTVPLGPGWYYFSVEARTDKILPFFNGASISVLEDSIMSADLKRTNDWTMLGFYLRIGPHGGDVDVALRLGGFMNLNRGKVFFRHASVVKVSGPPPGERHVFDLEQIRKDEVTGPIGHTWSLVAVFVMFIILTAAGWWLFSTGIA